MGCGSSKDSSSTLIAAAKRGDVSGVSAALNGGANLEARSFVRARARTCPSRRPRAH